MMLPCQKQHIAEMPPLSQTNNSVHPINEVMHDIKPDTVSTSWTQNNNNCQTTCKTHDNPQSKVKTFLLMPSDIEVNRHVPINNVNIS